MKVIVFLTEPASYTIDLVKKVYSPNKIDYKFLKKSSYSYPYKSKKIKNKLFINNYSFISKLSLIMDIIFSKIHVDISFILWL